MADEMNLGWKENESKEESALATSIPRSKSIVPNFEVLNNQLSEASLLVDDIVLKKYLTRLTELEIVPLDDSMKQISDIRIFKITEMVYQKDEYSTYKFASVFNSLQSLNCGVFIIADSNGKKTDFYMGVRSLDDKRTTVSLRETLHNALSGQFPGVKTTGDMTDAQTKEFLSGISSKAIAAVSCVANNKDEDFNSNEHFIQGLEKLALAMQGQKYTAVILAKGTPAEQLEEIRQSYETIYTHLSPFANMQVSYGTSTALNISDAFSHGTTIGESHSTGMSIQRGKSHTTGTSTNESESMPDKKASIAKGVATGVLGVAGLVAAPFTAGLSAVAASTLGTVINSIPVKTTTKGTGTNESNTNTYSKGENTTDSTNKSENENHTKTTGQTTGTSDNMQLTMQNKTLINTLERIDTQLKRIDECDSMGMWECAAYFMSDNQETAEMAAGTYKALIKGENSGVESSAVNFWGRDDKEKCELLFEYITNFVHPIFNYNSDSGVIPVTTASLVSGNELAIQMGLPRKSVCGFPVIEHAEFGKEVVRYDSSENLKTFTIGKVFSMGRNTETNVRIDKDSLTMHTFVTGSTGSGKSNTVYEILNEAKKLYNVPFMVIEPAKGEYKNIFGQFSDVTVYGTNPKKFNLLKINPFRFPADIHVLEHLDRLVEIFNVCWPMYAAMPAILKEAMERAYIASGWDINLSENPNGEVFPNFSDLLEQLEIVISESKYSTDSKGDYSGALCTRVRSLTNGLNGLIFSNMDLNDEKLFDKNVIVDLSRVGSSETKSLVMGLLVMKLNEYRMVSGKINSALSHITVLEEAHNLLKRTSTEQSTEGANLLGKSVEMLSNSIAEMRTYGEGFIIVDQSPGLLDMSVIRNTNTKIILRLPEQSDRELVGYAAGLNKEQIDELSKLERGVAAIYQNNWVEPILTKVTKCDITEKAYEPKTDISISENKKIRRQLIGLLIQGRLNEHIEFDVDEIEKNLDFLALSTRNKEFVLGSIAEYRKSGKLTVWEDNCFENLSKHLVDILGVRDKVEYIVSSVPSNTELTRRLFAAVKEFIPDASDELMITLSQCFMKDLSVGKSETEVKEKIYKQWVDDVKGGIIHL